MEKRELSIFALLCGLRAIRTANYDAHATTMHFIGYIGACMALGALDVYQYSRLFELAQNAFNCRSKELRNAN